MDIRLLGNVRVHGRDSVVRLARSGERCVLATLAVNPGRAVTAATLADNIWSAGIQSDKAIETVADYVRKVRAAIKKAGGQPAWLRTDRGARAYVLDIDPVQVDYARFTALVSTGRASHDIAALQAALALWRGPALADVTGLWAESRRYAMETERLDVYDQLLSEQLRAGRHTEVARTVTALIDEVTPTERLVLLGARGMAAAGQHTAIRGWIDRATQRLQEATGADASPDLLDQLEQLTACPSPGAARANPQHRSEQDSAKPTRPVPRQLPLPPSPFTGRDHEVALLDKAVNPTAGTVQISTISGLGGIGKTWLALHWAHRHLDQFPDGQLFVDLRGFTPGADPMAPDAAVAVFLDALGVPPNELPTDPAARTGLYRTLISDRRMLIVLDNARDTTQVTPLLPGSPTCAVLVTSRDRLPGLATAYAAQPLMLDMFDQHRARDLFVQRLGPERLAGDPDAVAGMLACCGGLPLALSIVAGQVAAQPHHALGALAVGLRDTTSRMAALDDGDPVSSVPAALSWSYTALPAEQATMFGLLGLAPGPDIGPAAAASLVGLPVARARPVLDGLTQVSLLDAAATDRWRMHDVVGRYAAEQAERDQPGRDAALHRLADFYLHTAAAGRRLLNPQLSRIEFGPITAGAQAEQLADADAALAWFEAEHACLLAIQQWALHRGWYDTVWRLAWALIPFHWRRGHIGLDVVVWRCALDATEHLDDPATQLMIHRNAGQALGRAGEHGEALRQLERSLALAEQTGNVTAQAQAHLRMAQTLALADPDERELTHARHAVRLHRRAGNPVHEASALNSAGWAATRLGRYDEARDACQAALTLFRRHHNPDGQAATLDSLGLIAFRAGRRDQALQYYQEAIDISRGIGDDYNLADVIDRLASTHLALGSPQLAVAAWHEALRLYQVQERHDDAERIRENLATTGS